MIKRLITAQTPGITGAAILLGGASLASRVLGIVRDRVLAHLFGAGAELDAYFTAFRIPDLVYNLVIAGALSAGFVPLFTALYKKDTRQAWLFTRQAMTILGISAGALCLLLALAAGPLTAFIAPGFEPAQQAATAALSRILFLSPFLLGLSALISGVLQSFRYFFVYALAPLFYNAGIIAGALFFSRFWGINGVAWGVILGAALHLAVQLPAAWSAGFRPRLAFSVGSSIKTLWVMMVPRTISLAINQMVLLLLTVMATTLAAGAVTVFNFANNIQYVAIGMIGISFAIASFPALCEYAAAGDMARLRAFTGATARKIIFLVLPVTVLFILLRAEIVRVILGSGAFDWTATVRTADTLALFSLGLLAHALIPLYSRVHWSLRDSKTPMLCSIAGLLTTAAAAWLLVPWFEARSPVAGNGVLGLAAAFALGGISNGLLLISLLRTRLGYRSIAAPTRGILQITAAGLVMGISIQAVKSVIGSAVDMQTFIGVGVKLVVSGTIGAAIYALTAHALGSPETRALAAAFHKRFMRWNAVTEMESQEHL